jgi:hypothetical protein
MVAHPLAGDDSISAAARETVAATAPNLSFEQIKLG